MLCRQIELLHASNHLEKSSYSFIYQNKSTGTCCKLFP
uniref:Uncharacterized protein n=1 Tax=Arundo donax TaxID=35708 RepID=A0A0A8YS19_ARUDO